MKKIFLIFLLLFSLSFSTSAYRLNGIVITQSEKIEKELTRIIDSKFDSNQKLFVSVYNLKAVLYGDVTTSEIKAEAINLIKQNDFLWPPKTYSSIDIVNVVKEQAVVDVNMDKQTLAAIYKKLPDNLLIHTIKITVFNKTVYLQGVVTRAESDLIKKAASTTTNVKDVYAIFDIISEADAKRVDSFGIK